MHNILWLFQKSVHRCLDQEDILSGIRVFYDTLTLNRMKAENKLYFQAEKEAIFLILTGIGDEIYSTVDACNTAKEMWTAIERLQQGESLNVQDVKTNLFWEFGKFTSRDGESMEFLLPICEGCQQRKEIDTSLTHKLFDVLKKFQKRVNDIRSERLARSANPLALIAAWLNQITVLQESCSKTLLTTTLELFKLYEQGLGRYHTKANNMSISQAIRNQRTVTVVARGNSRQFGSAKDLGYSALTARDLDTMPGSAGNQSGFQEVSPAESSSTDKPLEQVQNHDENDMFANVRRHSEQPESINDTYVLEKDDSNVIPDSSNICTNDNQVDQNAAECVDERAALANLIANLTLDMEENKTGSGEATAVGIVL
ncbi:hypothetical protein Tco_0878656 [Tanacetum coccineum]|uniref:Uncharacterized protein n=1 Tax=Tanacetum coccineum TaxID=301880 RepID=A0ABQ5BYG6_9ASTR